MLFLDGLSLLLFSAGLFLLRSAVACVRHLASLLLAFLFRQRTKRLACLRNNFESSSKLQFSYVHECTVFHGYSFYQFSWGAVEIRGSVGEKNGKREALTILFMQNRTQIFPLNDILCSFNMFHFKDPLELAHDSQRHLPGITYFLHRIQV